MGMVMVVVVVMMSRLGWHAQVARVLEAAVVIIIVVVGPVFLAT